MSHSCHPLLADVIPLIDILTRSLDAFIEDSTNPRIVVAAASKALAVLNKYYSKTDDSKMYRLCISTYYVFSCTVFLSNIKPSATPEV